jgi:hypothetical protein
LLRWSGRSHGGRRSVASEISAPLPPCPLKSREPHQYAQRQCERPPASCRRARLPTWHPCQSGQPLRYACRRGSEPGRSGPSVARRDEARGNKTRRGKLRVPHAEQVLAGGHSIDPGLQCSPPAKTLRPEPPKFLAQEGSGRSASEPARIHAQEEAGPSGPLYRVRTGHPCPNHNLTTNRNRAFTSKASPAADTLRTFRSGGSHQRTR